jgi:hypothetical protein
MAEMPSGTCELSCALKTNVYAICKYEENIIIMSLVGLAPTKTGTFELAMIS